MESIKVCDYLRKNRTVKEFDTRDLMEEFLATQNEFDDISFCFENPYAELDRWVYLSQIYYIHRWNLYRYERDLPFEAKSIGVHICYAKGKEIHTLSTHCSDFDSILPHVKTFKLHVGNSPCSIAAFIDGKAFKLPHTLLTLCREHIPSLL